MANKWTKSQTEAIRTTGTSLLVSAAAGSGKTAVLAERCAFLVCDAEPACDVDQLLVVTFTETAAAEMKSRIGRSIRERVARSANPRLAQQLALIDRMQVSTLHGFCARLIRQHFHLLGLDPAFTVLDGDEAALLRMEIARQLFVDRYERDTAGQFQAFIDAYGDGNDEPLIKRVIQTQELLRSLVDPSGWIARANQRIAAACGQSLTDCDLGRELLATIEQRLTATRSRCADAINMLAKQKPFAVYLVQLKEIASILDEWIRVLKHEGLDALTEEFAGLELPKLPSISNATPGKEAAKQAIDSVRDEIKSGPLCDLLRFTSAQWIAGLRSTRQSAKVFLELVEEFGQRYRREKDAARTLDFSDLEQFALAALKRGRESIPSDVAKLLHRQFRHVLVDEYQDINEVQDAILNLVSTECLDDATAKNLFCVGDVKQSIYRFRLAEPHRFLQRHERLRQSTAAGTVIDLQSNFRSRAPLLDALNNAFERLMTQDAAEIQYDDSHRLHAGLEYPNADGSSFAGSPIELHLLPPDPQAQTHADDDENEEDLDRSEREALLCARRIRVMTDPKSPKHVMEKRPDGTLAPRPIRLSDIVILLRSMRYKVDDFADILRRSGIPVHSESGAGFFDSMEVRDVLALLKVLDNRRQDIPLAAFLRSPIAALPEPEDSLARIRLAYPHGEFHDAVIRYANKQSDELAARLTDVLKQIDCWREMAQRRPLAQLIWDIYDSTGYLAFCAGLRGGRQRVANLIDLHERARQFGSFQRQGLSRFLGFLDSLQDQSDLGQPPVVSGAEDVVRIMSIHKSKGLEFPVVILPDLGKKMNFSDCQGSILVDREAYLGMSAIDEARQIKYPSLASMLVETRLRKQMLAEELRVLYVAMTRAKEHLILIGTCEDKKIDGWNSRWTGHAGPLPTDTILCARKMLDWLGPVAVATNGANPVFTVTRYAADEVAPTPDSLRPVESKRLTLLAKLDPLTRPPPKNPLADEIIQRLTTPYPHERLTKVPAALSVTAISKHGKLAPAGYTSGADETFPMSTRLPMPRSLDASAAPLATDIGSATHVLLEHLDFNRTCDTADLTQQLQSLLARRLISPASAKHTDLEAICWLVSSPIGQLICKHPDRQHRELPVYFPRADDAAPGEGEDRTMVRSRLDVLVKTPLGYEVIDYKTDRVTDQTLPDRIRFYEQQMSLYQQAVQAVTGQPPAAVHLVFLAARRIHTIQSTNP